MELRDISLDNQSRKRKKQLTKFFMVLNISEASFIITNKKTVSVL